MQQHFKLRHLICLAALWAVPLTAQAQEADASARPTPQRARVLVVPYRVAPGAPVDGETANAILAARMRKIPVFDLMSTEELGRLAEHQALLQGLGADDDTDALVKLGQAAQADKLVAGSLGVVGGTVVAKLVLLDVHNARVERQVAGTATGQKDLIIPMLNQQADALLAYALRTYAKDQLRTARAPQPVVALAATRDPASQAPTPMASLLRALPLAVAGVGGAVLGLGLGAAAVAAVSLITARAVLPVTSEAGQLWAVQLGLGLAAVPVVVLGAAITTGGVAWAVVNVVRQQG